MALHQLETAPDRGQLLDDLSYTRDGEPTVIELSDVAVKIHEWLLVFGLFVAVLALIIVAIRIMFARATGDVNSAKVSSNGIGWILGSVVLIAIAPTLVRIVAEAFGIV